MVKVKSIAILCIYIFCATNASAWTLLSPVSGYITGRKVVGYYFGENWDFAYCDNLVKKHTGIDVQANVNEPIYAAYDGWIKVAALDKKWGGYVTIDHSPTKTFLLTTTYWHIIPEKNITANMWVTKGQLIGRICGLSTGTHFHFGVRPAGYSNTSNSGALPQKVCGGYPAFPSYFIDPLSLVYEYNYK